MYYDVQNLKTIVFLCILINFYYEADFDKKYFNDIKMSCTKLWFDQMTKTCFGLTSRMLLRKFFKDMAYKSDQFDLSLLLLFTMS